MNIQLHSDSSRIIAFVCMLLGASFIWADESIAKDAKAVLNNQISEASVAYSVMQSKPETSVPNWVVKQAKGVIILNRWSGAAGVGVTGGSGIGMKKNANNSFSAPAFYTIGGASVGVQLGGGKTTTVAFLMSDKALNTLNKNKFVWSGNIKAVAGDQSNQGSTVNNAADVILYQQSSGLDVGATVAATQVSVDNDSNRKFYDNVTITPEDIFSGKVKAPDSAKTLTDTLNIQAR